MVVLVRLACAWIVLVGRLCVIGCEELVDQSVVTSWVTFFNIEHKSDDREVWLAGDHGKVDPVDLGIIVFSIELMLGRRMNVHLPGRGQVIDSILVFRREIRLPNVCSSVGTPTYAIWPGCID